MPEIWLANLIGGITLPLTVWQFGFSRSKKHFLWLNFVSCVLWFISLHMTHQNTAAWVSLTAGVASLTQSLFPHASSQKAHWLLPWIVALLSMNIAVWIAPPTGWWDVLPVAAFIWVRSAEVFQEWTMRLLITVSPLAWSVIAWHGRNYGLIPADLIGFFSMFWWFYKHSSVSMPSPTAI